jgi:hypothetical protein
VQLIKALEVFWKMKHAKPSVRALALAFAGFLLLAAFAADAQEFRRDPALVTGPDACGECHKRSVEAWQGSHHFSTFKDMPRTSEAKEISKKMGLKRVKAGSDCLTCHFTSAMVEGKAKPIAGITCESCHGAGKDWIDVHSDFGGKDVKAESEDAAHKKKRYEDSEAAGMIRPVRLYEVAQNCYSCHSVPNEKLVNVGGHPVGSKIELVRWSQGEVRHTLWYTEDNTEASLERRRMFYIVGKALDLEAGLRGLANATTKGPYAISMAKRSKAASLHMAKIAEAVPVPEIKEIATVGASAKLKLNNADELNAVADKVAKATKALASNYDGSEFAAIDSALPTADKYKGEVFK